MMLLILPAEVIGDHLHIVVGDVQQAALHLAATNLSVGIGHPGLPHFSQRGGIVDMMQQYGYIAPGGAHHDPLRVSVEELTLGGDDLQVNQRYGTFDTLCSSYGLVCGTDK